MTTTDASITVTENGPYIVRGNVPLLEKAIVRTDEGYGWKTVREIPHGETYALCRCGRSKESPFCDGSSHKRFKGREKADRRPFSERCDRYEGPGLVLEDDRICSMSRFCHRAAGTPWKLLPQSDDPSIRDEIVAGSVGCPSGRIRLTSPEGAIDVPTGPEIWIIQDPGKGVSGGIYAMGGIRLIGSDGFEYERRERMVLCRCGASGIMPFCDSAHINRMFRDDRRRRPPPRTPSRSPRPRGPCRRPSRPGSAGSSP